MKFKHLTLAAASILSAVLASQGVMAADIALGDPAYGGNGCPAGTASATLSPDAKSLSILFDQFIAEAGGSTGRTIDRKNCNVAIPVHIPQGYSVSVFAIDYRGFNALPVGGSSQFSVEYFFAGFRGPRYQRDFTASRSPLQADYLVRNTLEATAVVWSPCGEDVILRTNTSMFTRTNNSRQQAMSTVDSIDLNAGIVYQLQWRRCN